MKLDKAMIEALLALDDDELWGRIVMLGKSKGFSLPTTTPQKTEMAKLRQLLQSPEKLDMTEALRLLRELKRGSRHG